MRINERFVHKQRQIMLPSYAYMVRYKEISCLYFSIRLRKAHLECMSSDLSLQNIGPGLIPGSWIMMRHVSCILLLEWSTTSQMPWVYRISVPYAQKDHRFLFKKRRGQPRELWSLVSTIDGSTLPQVCVEEQLC